MSLIPFSRDERSPAQIAPPEQRHFAFTKAQLAIIKDTVARDCTQTEFDQFVEVARSAGLNPLKKQICAIIFGKNDASRRRMEIITQIDGYRTIASRAGNYRPMADPPKVAKRAKLVDARLNPLGIERATVTVFQRHGSEWFPVVGVARWAEFAPIERAWISVGGERRREGDLELAANWARMPELMLAKCAEAQALRRGWPEDLAGLYVEEEMAKSMLLDMTPSAVVEAHEARAREQRLGGSHAVTLLPSYEAQQLVRVERGHLADWLLAWTEKASSSGEIDWFCRANREALNIFWGWDKADALAVKAKMEARAKELDGAV